MLVDALLPEVKEDPPADHVCEPPDTQDQDFFTSVRILQFGTTRIRVIELSMACVAGVLAFVISILPFIRY